MSLSDTRTAMPVDVVSDVVCPWCFIGKRRLEKAMALAPDIPLSVRWRPYFLNPWVPREGIGRTEYLTTKFGSVETYARIAERIAAAAEAEGLVYRVEAIARQPNTLDCHRLIRWAGANGAAGSGEAAGRMKQRLMELYFSEGADLTARDVLVQAAVDCGMDADEARKRLASDADELEVTAEAMAASNAGVEGVPCFIFGGVLAVAGAQAPDYLAGALARAFAQFERRLAAGEIANPEARPY
ncbi:MAG: DsbA family oxidoreductase [Rhodoplanes sp.]|jgi:predicted DsbA family dithiol-disulfide isomerase